MSKNNPTGNPFLMSDKELIEHMRKNNEEWEQRMYDEGKRLHYGEHLAILNEGGDCGCEYDFLMTHYWSERE
jgi:hypothetical protein